MKVAVFGYAWNKQLQPDAYMSETMQSLTRAGADVDFYMGSQISKEYGIYGLKEDIQLARVQRFIEAEGYDAAFAFNNSMFLPEFMGAIKGRIVDIIVDEPEHFFDYHRVGPFEALKQDVEIVAMSSAVEGKILAAVPDVARRLHFMLPATHLDRGPAGATLRYPISWVASYVGDLNLDEYLRLMIDQPEYYALTVKCLGLLERHGNLKTVTAENGADMALIKGLVWSFDYFQTQMQNILTNRSRVEVVERLEPHGLALFGNPGWQKLLTYNAAVLKALQPGPAPTKHADLRRIYNSSRISINLPQAHVATGAVQYRVIDVIGSNALMITKYDEGSDLYRVFGKDCPVPTYTNLDELEQLCKHYLANEGERRELVTKCNALLDDGFDFESRAGQLLRIAGLEPTPGASPGNYRWVDLRLFSRES